MRREDLSRYMSVKRTAYCIYMLENPKLADLDGGKDCSIEKQKLLKGLSETERQIFIDTLVFPYDLVLLKEFGEKSALIDVNSTLEKFGIDKGLFERKWHEYIIHSYGSLVENNTDIKFSDFALKMEEIWLNLQHHQQNTNENEQKK